MTTLYVGNLPYSATEERLSSLFDNSWVQESGHKSVSTIERFVSGFEISHRDFTTRGPGDLPRVSHAKFSHPQSSLHKIPIRVPRSRFKRSSTASALQRLQIELLQSVRGSSRPMS